MAESKVVCYEMKSYLFVGWCHLSKSVSLSAYILYLRPDSDFKCFNRLQMAKENLLSPIV